MLLNFTQEKSRISLVFVLFIGLFSISETAYSSELNVYSHRQPFLINPFLSAFENETGVKVNVVFASKGLVQRLLAEGSRSPAM